MHVVYLGATLLGTLHGCVKEKPVNCCAASNGLDAQTTVSSLIPFPHLPIQHAAGCCHHLARHIGKGFLKRGSKVGRKDVQPVRYPIHLAKVCTDL